LPNAPRPFRANSTDGIHHGWDFYVHQGTPVRAIEEGTIFHVKRDFSWDEMKHLNPGNTDLEEQENLDTYRGNTVYLKTRS
jgi:murein DD-endopeptidase MepM/ murein hydrolase activator NlpD